MFRLEKQKKRVFPSSQKKSFLAFGFVFLFAFPASTNYQLRDFGFGSGGEENMTSSNYAIDGISGEGGDGKLSGTNYNLGAGLLFTQQANVPPAPTFDNPSNYYNKLRIIIATGNNPTDAKFAIAISDDNWSTTRYVQSDLTVGSTLGLEDYQTYSAWGSGSGSFIIGLSPSTTYKVKVKAMQGKFTETGYGPESSVATASPQLSFDIDVSASDTETAPPYSINLGSLPAGTVVGSSQRIWVDISTNGVSGGKVYASAQNAGLYSSTVNHTIASVTGNLSALSDGFGLQGASVSQGSGGPLSIVSPYDQSGDIVGVANGTIREIFSASNPITSGRGSFLVKAKSSAVTPASGDYTETVTIIVAGSF